MYSLALKIVTKLVTHGHVAYFAGGWVRDFVMKRDSDDIDIATSASPEQILDLFPDTLLVGIQFGVVIVLLEGHPFEVATFRKDLEYLDGRKPTKIAAAPAVEDALRRDFTINGMFYDPVQEKIHDFVGGVHDIQKGIIRTIGNPDDRFFEDRLRMIRAVRFAARFNFKMDVDTAKAIEENAFSLFPAVAMERIGQEFTKMQAYPQFDEALILMHRLRLLGVIFPDLQKLHLHELQKRVLPIKRYPKAASPSLFLQEIAPEASLETLLEMGRYLKLPNRELDRLKFYRQNVPFALDLDSYSSVYFYAHPDADSSLRVYAARLEDGSTFLQQHLSKKKMLDWHIRRLVEKKPVLSSKELFSAGIRAGKGMGALLKEAERLSIEQDIREPETLLAVLKQSGVWSSCKE